MTLKKSTDSGVSWTNTGSCGASSATRLQCGTYFDAELADSGTRWRATVRNAAGTRTSTPTTITVCEAPLPCDQTVVATPGGAATLEGDDETTSVRVPLTLSRSSTQTITVHWTAIFNPSWSSLAGLGAITDDD